MTFPPQNRPPSLLPPPPVLFQVLHEKVQTFAARIRDLQQKLAAKMAEAEASGQTVRAMNRDVEQLKTDNRGMIQLMNGMEKQLSEFAAREEQTDRLAHESKEMAERAVLERDQATATEAYLRQELAVRVCVFVCLFVCFCFIFLANQKPKSN